MKNLPKNMILKSVKVDKKHIGYLKWLLESHDGMATPTTREGAPDIVDLMISPDFVNEMKELIEALTTELNLEPVPPPSKSPL